MQKVGEIERCKLRLSLEPIDINDVVVEHVVVSSKYFFRKEGLQYFIRYVNHYHYNKTDI